MRDRARVAALATAAARAAAVVVIVQTREHQFDAGRRAPPASVARRRLPLSELVRWEAW